MIVFYLIALVNVTEDAFFVGVSSGSRGTNTISVGISDFIWWTVSALVALNSCVSLISWQALANHGANRQCVEDFAYRIDSTWLGDVARIHTFAADASCLRWTVAIIATDFLVLYATLFEILNEAWLARAFWPVIEDAANFVNSTFGRYSTRIFALLVYTGLIRRTLRVRLALDSDAGNLGVSSETWLTNAR